MTLRLKIYTKTGDKGQTSLYGGKRVGKDDQRVEAYGTIDELNSAIAICVSSLPRQPFLSERSPSWEDLSTMCGSIQSDLFIIGAILAGEIKLSRDPLCNRLSKIEQMIDEMDDQLPVLKHFILPGGTILSSHFHFARTICRRAERRIVAVAIEEKEILQYLNRLSDLLFVSARYINFLSKVKDSIWNSPQ